MKLLHSLPPYNFGGVEFAEYAKSRVVVLPVPYDATASYKSGAREGSHAIISASRNMEWFDEEMGYEPASVGLFTLDELEPDTSGPEGMANRVRDAVEKILLDGKFPLMLGGEHSISAGAFEAFRKKYRDLTVLQFDAHPDLRNEYENSKYNHACVMRRAHDLGLNIVQIGIRSVCKEDYEFMNSNKRTIKTFYAKDRDMWKIDDIVNSCASNVYVSFDVDAFDSSVMPATGTPEPGGLHWQEAMKILRAVSGRKKIVGADVVELLPTPGLHACDFLAAKLAYKIIGYAFESEMEGRQQ